MSNLPAACRGRLQILTGSAGMRQVIERQVAREATSPGVELLEIGQDRLRHVSLRKYLTGLQRRVEWRSTGIESSAAEFLARQSSAVACVKGAAFRLAEHADRDRIGGTGPARPVAGR